MKRLLIIAGILVVVLAGALLALSLNGSQGGAVTPTPTPVVTTPSPSPSLTPRLVPAPDHDAGTVELSERFPAVRELPYENPYWELAVGGEIKDGVVPLVATVYVVGDQDAQAQIRKQRPYILGWLTNIGQAPGTYTLHVDSWRTDGY